MSIRVRQVLMTLSLAVLAAGCAAAPTERADAVRARFEALGPEARIHAPQEFAEAQQVVAELEAELEVQSQRYAVGRSWDRAHTLVGEVEAAIERVEAAIAAAKNRAAAEATDAERARADAAATVDQAPLETSSAPADTPQSRPGEVAIPRSVTADGKALAAGTYRLRLADEAPAEGAAIRAGRWVEFVANGSVAGRSLAVVIPDDEIGEIAASSYPRNEAWVAELRGGEYIRVWLNRDGSHYLIHLPRS
jgi:hypothetical protein